MDVYHPDLHHCVKKSNAVLKSVAARDIALYMDTVLHHVDSRNALHRLTKSTPMSIYHPLCQSHHESKKYHQRQGPSRRQRDVHPLESLRRPSASRVLLLEVGLYRMLQLSIEQESRFWARSLGWGSRRFRRLLVKSSDGMGVKAPWIGVSWRWYSRSSMVGNVNVNKYTHRSICRSGVVMYCNKRSFQVCLLSPDSSRYGRQVPDHPSRSLILLSLLIIAKSTTWTA